jgi:hypothetical protein
MSEARISFRPLLHLASQQVIGIPRQPGRRLCVLFRLYAGRSHRQDGEIDPGLVHRLQPQPIEIGEAALYVGEQRVTSSWSRDILLGKFRCREVLLERDLAGGSGSLHLGAQHLGHGSSSTPLHKVAPAESGRVPTSGISVAAARMVIKWFHFVLPPDRAPPASWQAPCDGAKNTVCGGTRPSVSITFIARDDKIKTVLVKLASAFRNSCVRSGKERTFTPIPDAFGNQRRGTRSVL